MTARNALVAAALVAVTLAVYAPVARHDFVNYDDPEYVLENRHVTAGPTWEGVTWAFTRAHSANWHPLTWLSHMLDCRLFGLDPTGHHLTNVALHAATAVTLFAVLQSMTGALGPSALVAGLFALHPLRVESVAWIAERKDVLSGFLAMLTLACWVAWTRRPAAWRYLRLLAVFSLALLAKPMVVTLPFVLLLLDWWPLGRVRSVPPRRLVAEKLPLFALALAVSVVTFLVQRQAGAVPTLERFPLPARFANALVSYATYLVQTVWPVRLAVFYPPVEALPAWQVAGAGVLLAVASLLAVRSARRRPYVIVGWLWFLGTLFPVIQIVRAGEQAMADRFAYLPLVGIFLIAAWGLHDLLGGQRRAAVLGVVGGVVLAACAVGTTVQLRHWQNSTTLFTRALAVTEENYVAHTNLAEALVRAGRADEAAPHYVEALRIRPGYAKARLSYGKVLAERGERDAAAAEYAEALRLDPRSSMAHYNWGVLLADGGRLDDAMAHYREALRLDPEYANARTNLGWALAAAGRPAEAVTEYQAALRLRPDLAVAHNNLAVAFEDLGRLDEAIGQYREAVRLTPRVPRARYNLASVLRRAGRLDDAIAEYRALLRLDPSQAEPRWGLASALAARGDARAAIGEYREALRRRPAWPPVEQELAWLLATHHDPALRDAAAAVALAEQASRETGGSDPAALDTLAAAYAEAGRYAEATEVAGRAGALARAAGQDTLAGDIAGRERLYRAGRPLRMEVARVGTALDAHAEPGR